MKKIISVMLIAVMLTAFLPAGVFASDSITVVLNGEQMQFDVPPQIINSRTMVPLRAIFEALGAEVSWNGDTDTASGVRKGVRVTVSIGSDIATVSGKATVLDQSAVLIDGRTLVPLRFISEAYGAEVLWDGDTRTVSINAPESVDGYNIPANAFTEVGTWTYTDDYLQGKQDNVESDSDATVTVRIEKTGDYKLWAMSKDYATNQPGSRFFNVKIDGVTFGKTLGQHGIEGFAWEDMGMVHLEKGDHEFALHDTSGFFGRCKGLFLCADPNYVPDVNMDKLAKEFPQQDPLASLPLANFPAWANGSMTGETSFSIEQGNTKMVFYQGVGTKGNLVQNEILVKDGNNWVTTKGRNEDFGFLLVSALKSEYVSCAGELTVGGGSNVRQTVNLNGEPVTLTINDFFDGGYPTWFIPRSAEKISDKEVKLYFDKKDGAELSVTIKFDELSDDPKVTLDAKFDNAGTYSFLLFTGEDFSDEQYDNVTAPFMFVKKKIPEFAEMYPECYLFTPMATFTRSDKIEGKDLTTGIAIDPTSISQSYPYPDTAAFGLVLRTATGRVRGQFCAPQFGSPCANFNAGDSYTVSYRILNHVNDWYPTFRHVAEKLYKNTDVRENYYTSINEAVYNVTDLMMDDVYGGWDAKDMGWYNMEAQSVSSQSNMFAAVQRYLLTGDEEILEKRAIPTLAWIMSRTNSHFVRKDISEIKSTSYSKVAPTPLSEEPILYNTSTFEGLYEMSQGRMPYLLNTAVEKASTATSLDGVTSQIALYNATGDEGYLKKLEELAERLILNTVDENSAYMNKQLLSNGFVFGDYSPTVHALLAAYETTGNKKFLDGAEKATQLLLTATSNMGYQNDYATTDYHIDPVETMNAHRISCEKGRTPWFWHGDTQWRLGFDMDNWGIVEEMKVAIPDETVPGWLPAQAGLGTEHPKTAVNGNYIYMNSWASMVAKLAAYTGDDYFMTQARNAMVGRFGNYAGYYQERYVAHQGTAEYPYVGPDYTLIYWHHIPVFAALLEDYLISSVSARSDFNVEFPAIYQFGYAYFVTNQYGHKPGKIYDQDGMWLWLDRDVLTPDSVNVDYITARKDGVFGAAMINEKDEPLTTTLTLGSKVAGGATYTGPATLYDKAGNKSEIQVENGKFTLTIPARGILSVIINLPEVKKPDYALDNIYFNTDNGKTVSQHTNGKSYALQLNDKAYYAYVYVTDMPKATKEVKFSYTMGDKKGEQVINEYPFETIIKVENPDTEFVYTVEATTVDGKKNSYGGGTLKGIKGGATENKISATPEAVKEIVIADPSKLKFETFTAKASAVGIGSGFRAVIPLSEIPFEVTENVLTGLKVGVILTSKSDGTKIVSETEIIGNEMRADSTVIVTEYTDELKSGHDYGPTHKGEVVIVPHGEKMPDIGKSSTASQTTTKPITPSSTKSGFEMFTAEEVVIGSAGTNLRAVVPFSKIPFDVTENMFSGVRVGVVLKEKKGEGRMVGEAVISANEMRADSTVLVMNFPDGIKVANYGDTHKGTFTLVPDGEKMPDLGKNVESTKKEEVTQVADFKSFEAKIATVGNSDKIRIVVYTDKFPFDITKNSLKGLKVECDFTVKASGKKLHLESVVDSCEVRDNGTAVLVVPTTADVPMMDYQKLVEWSTNVKISKQDGM